jgi:hypothetical protein
MEATMATDNLITIAEYAARIGKAQCSIRQKCQRGNLPGAVKIGRDWLIPADAPYEDRRIKSGEYKDWRKKR